MRFGNINNQRPINLHAVTDRMCWLNISHSALCGQDKLIKTGRLSLEMTELSDDCAREAHAVWHFRKGLTCAFCDGIFRIFESDSMTRMFLRSLLEPETRLTQSQINI